MLPAAKPLIVRTNTAGKQRLRNDLLSASASKNPALVAAMISRALQTTEGVGFMKEFLKDETLPMEARKRAAEALMRAGTEDSVQDVLTAATRAFESGKSEAGGAILSALQNPIGLEGARGLLNVLLGQDGAAGISYPLPEEVQSTVRKTLRGASDAEGVGTYMAQLYSELLSAGQAATASELLDGVAHPAMLAELLVRAQAQGKSDEVAGLFDRLIATNDSGVVGAVARIASSNPSLLNNASEALFNWSQQHPQQAQPGVFAEYLNNTTLSPAQRVAAAYGLAGSTGSEDARRALEKTIAAESDQNTKQYFQNALANLQKTGQAGSLRTPKK